MDTNTLVIVLVTLVVFSFFFIFKIKLSYKFQFWLTILFMVFIIGDSAHNYATDKVVPGVIVYLLVIIALWHIYRCFNKMKFKN